MDTAAQHDAASRGDGLFQLMLEEDREEYERDENPAEVAEVQVRCELEQRRVLGVPATGGLISSGAASHAAGRTCDLTRRK